MRYVCPECGDGGDGPGACPTDGTERAAVGADPILGTTIGSWRVAAILGAGGMGRVYVAVQPQIGARVAIKVLRRESAANPDVVERFFNEARAVNLIKHEAIVDVIDLGRLPDGSPYIVMEYLDGASLGAIVRRDKRLPLGTLARIVGDVLAALEAAHAKGIVHRDLKPDNVFVSPSGRVTVLDFGVAKLAAGDGLDATQTGSLLGTPAYMSPEQARSQPIDARADLYAAGVMLYEAATGTLPFIAANLFDLLQMHVTTPPRPPRELAPEIPEALEAVILRALAKDPANRFGSAAEMRRALASSVHGLPQLALASIDLSRDAAVDQKKPSDPFAETAGASIATDKTQASAPPAAKAVAAPEPSKPSHVQLSRGTLFALVGAAALLGLGGAALVLLLGRHAQTAPREPPIAERDTVPTAVDATATEAAPDIVQAPPANAKATPHALKSGFPDQPDDFAVATPQALDPLAYVKKTTAHALQLGGKNTRLTAMRVHHMNRAGTVDLTRDGSVEIIYIAPDRVKAGLECYITYDLDHGRGQLGLGTADDPSQCSGGVWPPSCPVKTIIERAVAKGMPADANDITLNKLRNDWMVSAGDWDDAVEDDCTK